MTAPAPSSWIIARLRLLRRTRVTKVVFIASDPKGYLKNFVDLGRASNATFVGDPFMPTAIQVLTWPPDCQALTVSVS